MSGNTYGKIFQLTTFGESHGKAIGGIIDGCPPGIELDFKAIQYELKRRKPGQSKITSRRKEDDEVEFLSGIFEGKTTGTPIAFIIINKDAKSADYEDWKDLFRPSHADFTYEMKYGFRDYRGGGRASARETAVRVVAGAIAKQILNQYGIIIKAYVSAVGPIELNKHYREVDLQLTDNFITRCPDKETSEKIEKYILKLKKAGDSTGGIINCVIQNCMPGLGEPVFDKLHAELGKAMLSINAVKGFEVGSGFKASEMKGSEHNDLFVKKDGKIKTETNFSGGIQGGISNGMDIFFRTAFKPVATIMKDQESLDKSGEEVTMKARGRHDPCVVPRAVPIVEGMTALVILDFVFRKQAVSKPMQ